MIGKTIAHYKISEKLGQGAMGVVYKAHDLKLKRAVALKFLPANLVENTHARARFIHEAQTTAALQHPNIAVVYDFVENKSDTVMVMEFIEGETLAQIIKLRKPGLEQILDWAIGIINGLSAAHEKGIIHRDIKPQNIMITTAGVAKIMDFGVAKLRGTPTLTEAGSRIGTLDYAAPEMVMGGKCDHRSDIFSLGVVLYELLTGQRPFQGDHDAAVVYAIVNEVPESPEHFRKDAPPALTQIIMKMLEKTNENRYQSTDELLTDLKEYKGNLNIDRLMPANNTPVDNIRDNINSQRRSGAKLSKEHPNKMNQKKWKKSGLYAAVLILLISIVWIGLQLNTANNKEIKSIAVLPLENLSGDPEQEYFVSGMTDALITNLARISALKVISKTSVMHYTGIDKTLPELAQELKVDAIVEGSVMRAGDDVRITVQLIEAATDRHLWAESYERHLKNILKLQNEVAREIVRQIKLQLTPQEQVRLTSSRSVNRGAYQAYLKGKYFFDKHSETDFRKSIKYFEAAIEKDSTFADAYAGLAMAYIGLGSPGVETFNPLELMQKAKAAATKALELDDFSCEAHSSLGFVKLMYEWDWAGAEKELKRGVKLNPNYAMGHFFYALYLTVIGDHEQAIERAKHALELDPFSVGMNVSLGNQFFEARQYNKAIEQHLIALEMNPNNWHVHWSLGMAYTEKGMFDKAIAEQEKAVTLSAGNPFVLSSLGHVYAVSGRRAEAIKILDEIIRLSEQRYVASFAIAQIYTGLGNKDQAINWLEKGFHERSATMIWLGQNSIFDSLRSDMRFINLMKKMGLDKYNIVTAITKQTNLKPISDNEIIK